MRLPLNKEGNIELDLFEIISEVIGKATEEERDTIVEYFGLQKPIRKWMVGRLADEFSRPCYNESIHDDRSDLLQKIKDEELKYYASLITDKMVDEHRHNKAYWEIYRWCSDHGITHMEGFPHQALKLSDWDWKREIEETVRNIIKTERPDLLKVTTDDIRRTSSIQEDIIEHQTKI